MTTSTTSRDRAQAVQRVKVGLIGLAAVLLLIGLASAVFNSVNGERPVAAIGAAQPGMAAEMVGNGSAGASPSEPLAELGVAPAGTFEPLNRTSRAR